MNLKTKTDYEANGILVRELASPDPHFRTKIFTTVPGSYEKPYYNAMYEIPNSLNNNDEFDMNAYALPASGRRDCDAIIWNLSPGLSNNSKLTEERSLGLIALVTIILIIIGAILILACIYSIVDLLFNPHPCGPQGDIESINECYKKIIFPDCSWKWFNSCAGPDENGDGIPDGVVEDEGDPPPRLRNTDSLWCISDRWGTCFNDAFEK